MELTLEQKKVVDSNEEILIVKGVAGSGKSLVALERAKKLAKQELTSGNKKKVLFLTYANGLIRDLKSKSKDFTEYLEVASFSSITSKARTSHTKYIDKFSIERKATLVNKKTGAIVEYTTPRFAHEDYLTANKIRYMKYQDYIKKIIKDSKFDFRFIKDEFEFIKTSYIRSQDAYLKSERVGRVIPLTEKEKKFIYSLLTDYRKELMKDKRIDFLDYHIHLYETYFEEYIKKEIAPYYSHIILDESQDLNKVDLLYITKMKEVLGKEVTLTLLYDDSQAIFPFSFLGNKGTFKEIGLNITNKNIKHLSYSYRTTRQIHQPAYKMLANFEEEKQNLLEPVFVENDEGIKPVLVNCSTNTNSMEKVAEDLKFLLEIYKPNEILVIAPYDAISKKYVDYLKTQNIKGRVLESGDLRKINNNFNKLDTMYEYKYLDREIPFYSYFNIKGLEAKAVLLLECDKLPAWSSKDLKLDSEVAKILYVAMTRATEFLCMYATGEINNFYASITQGENADKYFEIINSTERIDFFKNIVVNESFRKANKTSRYQINHRDFKAEKEKFEEENRKLEEELKEKDRVCQVIRLEAEEQERKYSQIKIKNEKLEALKKELEEKISKNIQAKNSIKKQLKDLALENARLKEGDNDTRRKIEEDINKLKEQNKKLEEESKKNQEKQLSIEEEEKIYRKKYENQREEIKARINKEFSIFPQGIQELLINGRLNLEYKDNQAACFHFGKAIELAIREASKPGSRDTFGWMLKDLSKNSNYRKFTQELYDKKIVAIRNKNTHTQINKDEEYQLKEIYDYIFIGESFKDFYNKIKEVEREKNGKNLLKNVRLEYKGFQKEIEGKERYIYLLNNEKLGASIVNMKKGIFDLEGHYIKIENENIFIIEYFEEIEN